MKAIRLFLTLILLVLLVPFAVLALPAVAILLIISWLNGLEWEKPTDDKTKPD